MKCKNFILSVLYVLALPGIAGNLWAAHTAGKIKIAATSTTLASLTEEIAGDRATVHAVASPRQDIHFYPPSPKDVLKVKKADVVIHGGLDLEAWRDPLLNAAGNLKFLGNGEAAIDAAKNIPLLEIPASVDRSQGDIHLFGNPHYWTDPENGKIMAQNIAKGLARLYPDEEEFFKTNLENFKNRINEKIQDWSARLAPYRGTALVTYHNSWPYFTKRFGFETLGQLEPRPGIPPTPRHLTELMKIMKEKNSKLILKESYHESRSPEKVSKETGATVVTMAMQVNENKETADYISWVEYNVGLLENALGRNRNP